MSKSAAGGKEKRKAKSKVAASPDLAVDSYDSDDVCKCFWRGCEVVRLITLNATRQDDMGVATSGCHGWSSSNCLLVSFSNKLVKHSANTYDDVHRNTSNENEVRM